MRPYIVRVFKGVDAFKKLDSFKDFKGYNLVVKRVIYRDQNAIL